MVAQVPLGDRGQCVDRARIAVGEVAETQGCLEANHRVGVVGQGEQRGDEGRVLAEVPLGQLRGLFADVRINILQRVGDLDDAQRSEGLKGPEGMNAPQRGRPIGGEFPQGGEHVRIASFDQKALGGLAPPRRRVGQQRDKVHGRHAAQPRNPAAKTGGGDEVVQPPFVLAAGQIEVFLDRFGDRQRMLDRLAVHVEDQERAVGRVGEVDGTEPVVGRREELDLLVGASRQELSAVLGNDLAMDEVAANIADEGVAQVFGRECVAAIDGDAGRRGEEAGGHQLGRRQSLAKLRVGRALASADDPPGLGRADAEDGRGGAFGGDVVDDRHARERRIAFEGRRRQDDLADVIAVATSEAMAPIVEAVTELAAAGDRLERGAIGLEPEVSTADRDGL